MKQIFFILLFASLKSQGGIRCLDAGGYYGDLRLSNTITYSGTILTTVRAAQGFAYEISQQLRLPEMSSLIVNFVGSECKTEGSVTYCSGTKEVFFYTFLNEPPLKVMANVELKLGLGPNQKGEAQLNLRTVQRPMRLGTATHSFKPPLGECKKTVL